jgi:hypothetical protein
MDYIFVRLNITSGKQFKKNFYQEKTTDLSLTNFIKNKSLITNDLFLMFEMQE